MDRIDQLLAALRRQGILRGDEIQRELGISQPVMSRLMRMAGSREQAWRCPLSQWWPDLA